VDQQTEVRFAGAAAGRAPLTWAQRQVWEWIHADFPPGGHGHLNADITVELPCGTSIGQVLDAIRDLILGQEALRTTFRVHDGQLEQVVAGKGVLGVDLVDAGADLPSVAAARLLSRYFDRGIDAVRELPLLAGVVVVDGEASHLVLVVSRMVVDKGGANNLRSYVDESLAAARAGVRWIPSGAGRQSLAQAEFERSEAGLRASEASLRYWREHLVVGPQLSLPFLVDAQISHPDRIQRMEMRSTAAARSIVVLAARYRMPAPAIILAALTAGLTTYTGLSVSTFMVHCGNRIRPALRTVVGNLKQHTLVTVRAADTSFRELVEVSASALLRAYRHGQYDSIALADLVSQVRRDRGIDVARSVGFNDMTFGASTVAGSDVPSAALVRAALTDTVVQRSPLRAARSHADFVFYLNEVGDRVNFSAHLDTGVFVPADAEAMFYGVERVLVAAATTDDDLIDWAVEVGIKPAKRDNDWILVDNSWIHLPTTRDLVAQVVGSRPYGVFPLDGKPTELAMFVATDDPAVTPRSLHEACISRLPGVRASMAPHVYTVCASAPTGRTDLVAWSGQPVIVAGTGR
jgi:hypothetical protein